jgi:hypothetical protein
LIAQNSKAFPQGSVFHIYYSKTKLSQQTTLCHTPPPKHEDIFGEEILNVFVAWRRRRRRRRRKRRFMRHLGGAVFVLLDRFLRLNFTTCGSHGFAFRRLGFC